MTGTAPSSTPWAASRRLRLGDVLLTAKVITDSELEQALEAQRSTTGPRLRLGQVLVELGLATERQIAEALGQQLGLEVVDLNKFPLVPEVVRLLPRAVAQRLNILVLARDGQRLTIAVSDPTDVVALDDVRLYTSSGELTVRVAVETQVRDHLNRVWSLSEDSSDVATYFDEVEAVSSEAEETGGNAEDAPTVRLVNMVLADAVRAGASDIHVEPQRQSLRIRYRVDGVLRDVMTVPRSAMASVVSRLKILSGVDIAERRLPQDGRTRITIDGKQVDARVSTLPSLHGEKVVIRLLARAENVPELKDTGLLPEQVDDLLGALATPQGLILITGPTGSGKTNTLYSALAEIHTAERNIVALEDPIEVQMAGVTQVQVHERSGLTFARGLRAVLRQDPDVILVGEVRDTETAGLAVRASLTGHLVLTTLHTNSALAALARLVDMGIEPYQVASSLSLVVAQRLVRKPCSSCVAPDSPDPALLTSLGVTKAKLKTATPMKGTGCPACGQSGYHGRVGVFEVLPITPTMRRSLARNPTEEMLAEAAGKFVSLKDSVLAHALAGRTTFEEAVRISPRD